MHWRKAEGVGIGTAIEPSDEGDNTTLQHVTIHSDYTHVTWGSLAPKVDGSERWTIKRVEQHIYGSGAGISCELYW